MTDIVTMFDTIGADASDIPMSAVKVAGYETGSADILWSAQEWALFPHAGHVRINQDPSSPLAGSVLDVETAAWTDAEVVAAVKARQAAGMPTAFYVSELNAPALAATLNNAGLSGQQFWVADWNLNLAQASAMVGSAVDGHHVVAVQWASPTSNPDTPVPGGRPGQTLRSGNLDLSAADASWWPAPASAPKTAQSVIMRFTDGSQEVLWNA